MDPSWTVAHLVKPEHVARLFPQALRRFRAQFAAQPATAAPSANQGELF